MNADASTEAYRRFCWPVDGLDGVMLAPFQVLATEGTTYQECDHDWHMSIADRLVEAAPDLARTTRRLVVDTEDPAPVGEAVRWWEELTGSGGEGMVVKPFANLTPTRRALAQPGLARSGVPPDHLRPRLHRTAPP
jgi:protein phosphatase